MAVQPETLDAYDDRSLVAAFQAGEEDAFSRIVGTHYHSLLAEARRRLQSSGEAEDAVQETLLRAYLALDRFGGEFRLRAWLSRILANACTDAKVRRSGELRLYDRLAHRRDVGPAADEEIGDDELRRKINEAVAALPDSYRVAFVLREIEERSYAEVAEEMSVTEPNARARVHRARSSLARSLRDGGAALAGFALPLRAFSAKWFTKGNRAGGQVKGMVGPRAANSASAAARQTGRHSTLVDLPWLSQSAVAPAAQAPISPLTSVSQVIAQVVASPVSQTLIAAAPDAARASVPIAGTFATLAVAGAAMISSGGGLAPPPAAMTAGPQVAAAAPMGTSSGTDASPASPSSLFGGLLGGATSGQTSSTSGASTPVSAPAGTQGWTWVDAASGTGSTPNLSPAAALASVTNLLNCGIAQWFGGATTPSLPPAEAFFSSDTLNSSGINPAFVADGGGTFTNPSGATDLHTYYGACSGGTTDPGLGVQLSNPANPGLGVLQLAGAFVSSQTSGGQTFNLYRGTGYWIGGDPTRGPVTFAAQVEVDDPSALTSLRVAFFGDDPGLAGTTTQAPASSAPAGPASDTSSSASAATAAPSGPAPAATSGQDASASTDPAAAPTQSGSSNTSTNPSGASGSGAGSGLTGSSASQRHG